MPSRRRRSGVPNQGLENLPELALGRAYLYKAMPPTQNDAALLLAPRDQGEQKAIPLIE
jgi:hypothetical protein